ncbi:unnamed protein product, partial [Urochloa humidicola]
MLELDQPLSVSENDYLQSPPLLSPEDATIQPQAAQPSGEKNDGVQLQAPQFVVDDDDEILAALRYEEDTQDQETLAAPAAAASIRLRRRLARRAGATMTAGQQAERPQQDHETGAASAQILASSSGRRRWWRCGVDAPMKVREWSELVAGPRPAVKDLHPPIPPRRAPPRRNRWRAGGRRRATSGGRRASGGDERWTAGGWPEAGGERRTGGAERWTAGAADRGRRVARKRRKREKIGGTHVLGGNRGPPDIGVLDQHLEAST